METQNRFKSWALWISVAGALWVILDSLGVTTKLGIAENTYTQVIDCIGGILIAFGICNNPTDKGNF